MTHHHREERGLVTMKELGYAFLWRAAALGGESGCFDEMTAKWFGSRKEAVRWGYQARKLPGVVLITLTKHKNAFRNMDGREERGDG